MKSFGLKKALFLLAFILLINPAASQNPVSENSDQPLEITADQTLEWRRAENLFIARGDALAVQGDVSLAADILQADYRDKKETGMEITKITASKNVVITSRNNKAYGEEAIYEIQKGLAVMTGNNLRMTAPDQTLTARDRFEYWTEEGRLIAYGDARLSQTNEQGQTNTLSADKIIAVLKEDSSGKRALHSLEALGNVVIVTPTETLSGARGLYRADINTAEITGGVTIKRGPNILKGARADIDLNTNISRMYGGAEKNGRVRGVFYPGSEEKPEARKEP